MAYFSVISMTVTVIFMLAANCRSEFHLLYVKPTANVAEPCPEHHECESFLYYLQNTYRYFQSETTMVLLGGIHEVSLGKMALISDIHNFVLTGSGTASTPIISCTNFSGFAFFNITNLTISHMTFVSCGAPVGQELIVYALGAYSKAGDLFIMHPLQRVNLFLAAVHNFSMLSVSLLNGTGHALIGINILGNSEVIKSVFAFNNFHTLRSACNNMTSDNLVFICSGGNMLLIFGKLPYCLETHTKYTVMVQNTSFLYGVDMTKLRNVQSFINGGSGVSAILGPASYEVELTLLNVNSSYNNAYQGPNMYFGTFDFVKDFSLNVINSTCNYGNTLLGLDGPSYTLIPQVAGVSFILGLDLHDGYDLECWVHDPSLEYNNYVNFIGTTFLHNRGIITGAVHLFGGSSYAYKIKGVIVFENCSFVSNFQGAVMIQAEGEIADLFPLQVVFSNCEFHNHSFQGEREDKVLFNSPAFEFYGVIFIFGTKNVTFNSCEFTSNSGSSIFAKDNSKIFFEGVTMFDGNQAQLGAGVALLSSSVMIFKPHTKVSFINNNAYKKGGGIYAPQANTNPCFFQIYNPQSLTKDRLDIEVKMINNTAGLAGNHVFGGDVDGCLALIYGAIKEGKIAPFVDFDDIFKPVLNNTKHPSDISSEPRQICLCNSVSRICPLDYPDIYYTPLTPNMSVYPGQTFRYTVVVVGQRYGHVEGVVKASIFPENQSSVEVSQKVQTVSKCQGVYYAVSSNLKEVKLHLTLDSCNDGVQWPNIAIYVFLKDCPPGFSLSKGKCNCAPRLRIQNIFCEIFLGKIRRSGSVWISIAPPYNTSNSFYVHLHCPYSYCNKTPVFVNLSDSDNQCAFNRSGILCGKCKPGFSALFGSTRCAKCKNTWIAMLILFIAAGILLVVFLIMFNLTVSVGSINGLIFFANIVRMNQSIFFPSVKVHPILSILKIMLSVFIAWVNLDLGIETCFYDGMDTYGRTWLQFVFPVYIWTMVGIIIIVSNRSTLAVKIIGSNSLSILATLFLLSYAKLLRFILDTYSFTYMEHPDNTKSARWLLDGNIVVAQGKHIPLLITAMLFLLFFIIPFTIVLFFAPIIQARSGHRMLRRWIHRFIPILDSYQGPYKFKRRFWLGFMLSIRLILFTAFTINELGDPNINLLIIVTMVILLLTLNIHLGYVYKKKMLNFIELSYILNLGILALWSSLLQTDTPGSLEHQILVSVLSIGIAFIEFGCIFLYHVVHKINKKFPTLLPRLKCFEKHATATQVEESAPLVETSQRPPTCSVIDLREELLTDEN